MLAAHALMDVPLGPDAGEPVPIGKGSIGIRNDWWLLKTTWMLLSVLVSGSAFGASIGAFKGRVATGRS